MEEDCQEEARKRKVGKKEKKAKYEQRKEKHEKIVEGIRSSQKMAFERQKPIERWDSSQIENEEGDQMAGQWKEVTRRKGEKTRKKRRKCQDGPLKMKERPNIAVEEDPEEMKSLSWIYVGRIWLKRWKRKSWTSTKSKRARKEPSKAEAAHWNGEECKEVKKTELESEEKIVGQEFSLVLENTICSVCKASRRSQQ